MKCLALIVDFNRLSFDLVNICASFKTHYNFIVHCTPISQIAASMLSRVMWVLLRLLVLIIVLCTRLIKSNTVHLRHLVNATVKACSTWRSVRFLSPETHNSIDLVALNVLQIRTAVIKINKFIYIQLSSP